MTRTILALVATLTAILPPFGCSRSPSSPPPDGELLQSHAVELEGDDLHRFLEVFGLSDRGADQVLLDHEENGGLSGRDQPAYVKWNEEGAETVLVLRVTIPEVMSKREHRLPLRLRRIGPFYDHEMSSYFEDGVAADGTMFGCNCFILLRDTTGKTVNVAISVNWTAPNGSQGSLCELLPITVGKQSAREFGNGISIEWEFEDPIEAADDEMDAVDRNR